MRVIVWGHPDETSAPAASPGGQTPGCATCPCGALCCARVSASSQPLPCLGLPELNLQLHPEPPALSVSPSTRRAPLTASPWDCWAEGFQNRIPDSSAIQLACPPGQARQHVQVPPQISHSNSPLLRASSLFLRAQIVHLPS